MYTVRQVPGNSEERRFATKAEILHWIYDRMLRGASYDQARREASEQFEIGDRTRAERRRQYISGLQEEAARVREYTTEAELRKMSADAPTGELVEDTTSDKTVSRAVSRFEMIEIEGYGAKKKGRKRWRKRKQ